MSREKILVVEDNADVRLMMVTHLERRGYDVTSAKDGLDGIQALQTKGPFAVMVTDLMMPNMNGQRLLREARQIDPLLQVIVITAAASIDSAIAAMREDGAYDYLTKPLGNISELSMAVARAVTYQQLQLEREELQARLLSETERLRLLIANISDAILSADAVGILTVVNPAAAQLLGRDDLVGNEALAVLPRPLATLVANWQTVGDRQPAVVEVGWPAGATQMVSLTPLQKAGRRSSGWVMVVRDITHLKRLDEVKMQALTEMADNIQMPLAQAMEALSELDDPAAVQNGRASDVARRLVSVWQHVQDWTNKLLTLVRYESGASVRLTDTDVSALMAEMLRALPQEASLKTKKIELESSLAEDLPQVRSDPELLRKTLRGLIGRAVQRSEPGGRVRLSTRTQDGQVWIEVGDDGPPLEDSELPHLFDRSFLDAGQDPEGTGLELAMVKAVIDKAGGQVWVRRHRRVGSSVALCLPVATDTATEAVPAVNKASSE